MALLIALIFASPFWGGGVPPMARRALAAAAFLVAAAAFLAPGRRPRLVSARLPVAAMIAIAILGFLQLLPLPGGALERVSPASAVIYHESDELLRLFGRVPRWKPRISIAPEQTLDAIRLVLAEVALFAATLRLAQSRARRRILGAAVVAAALAQVAVFSSVQLGIERLRGPFPNANSFAGYLEIALAVAFGALWTEVLVGPDRERPATGRAERLERRLMPMAWRILAWSCIAIGIGLTQSRGAITAASLTTLALLALGSSHPRTRSRRALAGVLAVAVALACVAAVAGRVPLLRFLSSESRDLHGGTRLDIWRASIEAWRQFPVLGSGLGSFADAFRRVQPRGLNAVIEQAHSDPLQILVTGGAVGLALGFVVYASLMAAAARGWWTQAHREESAVALAGIGALLSLTLHGLIEFNMSIPAIPLTLAVVLGLSIAAARARGVIG